MQGGRRLLQPKQVMVVLVVMVAHGCSWNLTSRAWESFIAFVLPGSPAQHMCLQAKASLLKCGYHEGVELVATWYRSDS